MSTEGFVDLGFAKVDIGRRARRGFPEAVFAEGKSGVELGEILNTLVTHDGVALATRASGDQFAVVQKRLGDVRFETRARMIVLERRALPRLPGKAAIVSAGTTDTPVVEEARVTLELFGANAEVVQDVGVAGIHRTLAARERFETADAIIVVAGMDGALPSVIGGLVSKPVIAVPTSVGYGTSFGGITALLAMLNSCASGVTVVNIDNGFGAAYAAALILRNLR
ncbi:MAG: nickel pincer cofactor biosynthesis protein LarB [Chthoniobacterales bacterium]